MNKVVREISLMPAIYIQAAVTIFASRAFSAKEGFLQDVDLECMTVA
jgi:hypothetical protein